MYTHTYVYIYMYIYMYAYINGTQIPSEVVQDLAFP